MDRSPNASRRALPAIAGPLALASSVTLLGLAASVPTADASGATLAAGSCGTTYVNPNWAAKYGHKQQLLARTPAGGVPDGVVTEPAFSRDSRSNKRIAFTSTATTIATPVRPGTRNVYVVHRRGNGSMLGDAWRIGHTVLISRAGGVAADGDSWGASMSGYTGARDAARGPRLMAFLSNATNLPGGNPTGTSAFTARTTGGELRRVAVPGTATGVGISGDSEVVYVTTTTGLWVRQDGRVRRLVAGTGMRSPSTTLNGRQAAFERDGIVYTATLDGRVRRIAAGRDPQADGGDPDTRSRLGHVRAISFSADGGAWRAEVRPRSVSLQRFGTSRTPTSLNVGGSTVAFGNGPNSCVEVRLMDARRTPGGYAVPQGVCPAGQGDVTDTAVSSRYNYVAFSCAGGGLYHFYVGDKNSGQKK